MLTGRTAIDRRCRGSFWVALLVVVCGTNVIEATASSTPFAEPSLGISALTEDFIAVAFGEGDSLLKMAEGDVLLRTQLRFGPMSSRYNGLDSESSDELKHRHLTEIRANLNDQLSTSFQVIDQATDVQLTNAPDDEEQAEITLFLMERVRPYFNVPEAAFSQLQNSSRLRRWYRDDVALQRDSHLTFSYDPLCGGIGERRLPSVFHFEPKHEGENAVGGAVRTKTSWASEGSCAAHPVGFILTGGSAGKVTSQCTVVINFESRLVRSQVNECLVRSMGLVGKSKLFIRSLVGERLPERADFFLDNKQVEGRARYAARLPESITIVDKLYLTTLYDDRLVAGMSRDQARPLVVEILNKLVTSLDELEAYSG